MNWKHMVPRDPVGDFVTFYEELCRRFLKGRIEEPYGTNLLASSESLTFLSWNYGNMVRGQKYNHTKVSPRT